MDVWMYGQKSCARGSPKRVQLKKATGVFLVRDTQRERERAVFTFFTYLHTYLHTYIPTYLPPGALHRGPQHGSEDVRIS